MSSNGLPKRKYPHQEDYQADMEKGLFHPENFREVPFETLRCYQQCHKGLMEQDLTTGCWVNELAILDDKLL